MFGQVLLLDTSQNTPRAVLSPLAVSSIHGCDASDAFWGLVHCWKWGDENLLNYFGLVPIQNIGRTA